MYNVIPKVYILMKNLIRELPLPNGLSLSFFDHTHHYFGDFYLVKMEILCDVPVLVGHFQNWRTFEEARALLGEKVIYSRIVEQMGVPSTEIERVLHRLMTNFMEHSLPYFASTLFPKKLVLAELNKVKRKKPRARYP